MSSFPTNGGDDELRTAVYPSNLAPIAVKLRPRAFQTICNFRFFDAKKNFRRSFRIEKLDFRQFGEVLEDPRPNGRQNQLPHQILLLINLYKLILRSVRPKIVKFYFFVRVNSLGHQLAISLGHQLAISLSHQLAFQGSSPSASLKAEAMGVVRGGGSPPRSERSRKVGKLLVCRH